MEYALVASNYSKTTAHRAILEFARSGGLRNVRLCLLTTDRLLHSPSRSKVPKHRVSGVSTSGNVIVVWGRYLVSEHLHLTPRVMC